MKGEKKESSKPQKEMQTKHTHKKAKIQHDYNRSSPRKKSKQETRINIKNYN